MTAEFPVHPAAELFPLLSGEEYEAFKADVAKNGQIESIWLYDGKILDGRNRYRACTDLGIEPRFRPYEGDSPIAFVWSLNIERRHLTKSQHAAIGVEMLPLFQEEARKRVGGRPRADEEKPTRNSEEVSGEAAAQVAAIVGVDRGIIYDAKTVKETNPALFEEVKQGKMSVHKARKLVEPERKRKPKTERAAQIEALAKDGHLATQIGEELGIGVERVRGLARDHGITLPDAAIGKVHHINARRVVESTVQGLEGARIGLEAIKGGDWDISAEDAKAWHASLGKSIKELNWLRNKLGVIANGN